MAFSLRAGAFTLSLDQPLVMGIVNVTPDSFSDGGDFFAPAAAIAHAKALVEQGAEMLDVGGESTRPGAAPTSADEELARIMPVLHAIIGLGVPVSVDTRRTAVMREVLKLPIAMINDVSALRDEGALALCAASNVAVCVMHMQGTPETMQLAPHYDNIADEVFGFLRGRAQACEQAGIASDRITLDPGFGFGKSLQHSVQLMQNLQSLTREDYPVLVGWSRKRVLGDVSSRTHPKDRVHASIAAALACVAKGAKIVRVHDVAATVDALKIWQAFQ
jgi:dihydropteroate synthase